MFNELTKGRELYSSTPDTARFPDWNAANSSSPNLYGFPYTQSTQGYVAPQFDVTVNTASYKHNSGTDTMEVERINSKGKVRVKRLSNGFSIGNVVENYNDSGEIAFAILSYSTRTHNYVTIIPGEDYNAGKFDKHCEGIIRLPECSKSEINALIGFEIKTAPCQKQKLFPHQGINRFENGVICFGGNPGFTKAIEKYISPSVLKRKGLVCIMSVEQIITDWVRVFCQHPVLCYLSNWYTMGLMQYFLNEAGIFTRDILCIKPSNNVKELNMEKLIPMLSTNNYHKYPLPTLGSDPTLIEKEHSEVYDGVFLMTDNSFRDEEKMIINGVKTVIRCSTKSNVGRSIPIILSKNAGHSAAKNAPDNAIIIDTEGVELDCAPEEIESITDGMTTLVYQKAFSNPMATQAFFDQKASIIRQVLSETATVSSLDTLIAMFTIEAFVNDFIGINRCTNDLLDHYISMTNNKGEKIMSSKMEKKVRLGDKLSEKFKSKDFRCIKKERNMRLDDDGKTGVINGDRLLISSAMLESVTDDAEGTIAAYNADRDLICTDGYTHPFDSHDSSGKYQRLYFYDFPADILDEDVLYMLQNLETEAYLLTNEESQLPDFMPMIRDKSGKVAGKLFVYDDVENDSIAIYGQAGEGKSHTKAQIMASRFALGYDILVFDTGDSDTYEALCKNLSKKFVDENIIFHSLDDGTLNIDIFNTDRAASLPTQKREVTGIIVAGVGELSVPQTNALRSVVSEQLEKTDPDKSISPDDLLRALNKEGATYESLRNRLEPFIEDIQTYGFTKGTWKDFFSGEHKIHVVQTSEGFSGNGNQIVDALLAVLFNYKRENPQRPLSVFIDEVQNHNLSASSPIRKILKEGRKHHLSIVAATQDFYARSTEIGSALGKAGMQIHHRPTQDSTNLVAAELRWNKADMARFDSMNRGDVIIKGALYNKELKRNIQKTIEGHIIDYLEKDDNNFASDTNINN